MRWLLSSLGLVCVLIFASCICRSREYQNFYSHLNAFQLPCQSICEEDYFLVILVDARHLDYTDATRFLQSIARHSGNRRQRGDVGHAWIYLQGKCSDGSLFILEGGHSGEREEPPARYFDGVMNYHDWGYANPTLEQMHHPRYEPNPIQYLWTVREDGFFQKGSGGHLPTFAAKISLSPQQFAKILAFVKPSNYPYCHYALMGPQCCTFVAQIAALLGWKLPVYTTMRIAPSVYFRKTRIRLWEDIFYSLLTFPTPDVLEKSLIQSVEQGKAEYALDWYLQRKS